MAYLGCAAALGYGVLKAVWSMGATIGLRDPEVLRGTLTATTGVTRFFDYWGTPILAGLAVVILLGLVYPWGNVVIVRPLLRALAWAGGRPAPEWLARLEAIRDLLASGGHTLAQGALGWLLARSPRTVPIPGIRSVAQAEQNAAALRLGPLPPAAMAEIAQLLGTGAAQPQ